MKMTNSCAGVLVLLVLCIMMISLAGLVVYMIGAQPERVDPVYMEFEVVAIDIRSFAYVGEDNQIHVVDWIQHGGTVEVFTSDRTYIMVKPSEGILNEQYKLYLNVSDLK